MKKNRLMFILIMCSVLFVSFLRMAYLYVSAEKINYVNIKNEYDPIKMQENNFIQLKDSKVLSNEEKNIKNLEAGFNDDWTKIELLICTNIEDIYGIKLDVNGFKSTPIYEEVEVLEKNNYKISYMVLNKFYNQKKHNYFLVPPIIDKSRYSIKISF